jgi:endonuclease G
VDAADPNQKDALQAAVRQVATEYLKQPNITSIGLGYKTVDGKPTDEVVLQFTVSQKVAPELVDNIGAKPIPETITANGITFKTDVVERDFEPHPVPVEIETKTDRKRRIDPIVPGVSIGQFQVTAGTLGCVVKDLATGEPRILSNWHVLQGGTGKLGDAIVQPGSYDDNRIDQNGVGFLVRSLLGLGGDCAIARPSGRGLSDQVLDLGVAVRKIGDPELGDAVVKSGRTTGVTYGRVTRIHTISKLSYNVVGEQTIGGFEIGPDPERPAENGEISMGGDSGSAWLAVDEGGNATDMMLGLHFGGNRGGPSEFALACYASSVFEKLEIAPLDAEAAALPADAVAPAVGVPMAIGYDPSFLPGNQVPAPTGSAEVQADYSATKSGNPVRHYTHYSLAMSAARKFARWVAWNVDGDAIKSLSRKGIDFVLDPAYEPDQQVDNTLYSHNHLDRGHIARRADLVWGSETEAAQANLDSFFFTNITPQLDDFNQSKQHGLWGELENAIFADADVDHLRLSLFGGPIFKDTDFPYRDVLVPRSFFKVIAWVENGTLKAKGFVLTQDDLEAKLESLGLEPFKLYQVTLQELKDVTSLDFGVLHQADTMPPAPEGVAAPVRRIEALSQVA